MNELIVKRKRYLADHDLHDGLLCDLVARGLWRMAFQSVEDAIERREKEIVVLNAFKEELAR